MKDHQQLTAMKTKLLRQLQLARRKAEAIDFVIRAKDDLYRVQDEISASKGKIAVSENGMSRSQDPFIEELNQIYIQGLQESLEFVLGELKKGEGYTDQLTGRLHRFAVPFDAIGDAIQFVLDTNFDIRLINKEIAETEDFLLHPPESLLSAMNPGATPGIYKINYLNTLKEIAQQSEIS